MNRHAKASSAASTQRQATGLGRIVRGAFVTRGAFGEANGSSAPSARGRLSLLGLSALALAGLVMLVASAFASKQAIDYFGTASGSGSKGSEFNNPRDIGVNRTGAGGVAAGTIYVADDNNNRVQRFSPSGAFVSAWGANVQTPAVNEVQTLTVNATGGTYTLSFDGATTAALAYNASSSQVQTALRGLSSVGGSNLSVSGSGNPFTITFNGKFTATNVPQTSVDDSNLSGAASTAHPTQGFGKYEICTSAANCIAGTATATANFNDNAKNGALDNPQSVAVDGDTGNVYVSDRDNFRVNEYSSTGTFIRSFGFGVDATVAGVAYEVCPAANRCTQGIAGAGAGQVGSTTTAGTLGIAVSQPNGEAAVGTVFLADSQNRRVNTYKLDGTNPSSFGSSTQFATVNPRKIAVDSRGIVYASDSNNANEIDRYDTENANGGGIGFIASIPVPENEVQRVEFVGFLAGDTFTIDNLPTPTCSASSTDPIAWEEGIPTFQASIKAALEAKCGADTFFVAGDTTVAVIAFEGTLGSSDQATLTCSTVTGSGTCGVVNEADGHPGALLFGPTSTATSGLAVDPDSDGAGPDEDVLYVLRDPSLGNTVVQQFGPTNDPGLTAPPTAVDDTHGAEAGFGAVQGLGLNDASGRLYVSATNNVSGIGSAHRVYILDNVTAPAATLDPVSTFDAHSATFTGEVNPNGNQTRYRFEYVDNAEFEANGFTNAAKYPLADVGLGAGTSPIALKAVVPHLVPGALYHVRLLATQVFSTTQTASEQTFTTPGVIPTIHAAATAGEEEATLRAAINPEGSEVGSYYFEWGASDSYGEITTPGTVPGGASPVAVEEELSGLTPGQTYHYRLIATNATGTAEGPDQTFTATTAPQFPERGYEIASQYPTGSIPVVPHPGASEVAVSENGNQVYLTSAQQPYPGSDLEPPADQLHSGSSTWKYGSVRGSDGWDFFEYGLSQGLEGASPSADGKRYIFSTRASWNEYPRLDPDDQNGDGIADAFDLYQRQPDGTLVWISRDPRIPVGTPQTATGKAITANIVGSNVMTTMSVDGRTVVFRSARPLSDADTTPGTTDRLYKWIEGEGAKFIGIRPDGSVPSGGSMLAKPAANVVSRDGSRVVWRAQRVGSTFPGTNGAGLYLQSDGQSTVEVTKETGVGPLPDGQPFNLTFRGGSGDLSRAFFTTASRLTPDSGAEAASEGDTDLYVYDAEADKVRDITPRLDGLEDPGIGPAQGDRARVRGVSAISEDGKAVYFVADARYDTAPSPQGELPSASGRNLYLAMLDGIDDPIELRFIASLGTSDANAWQDTSGGGAVFLKEGKTASASPDGSLLGFGSEENLTGQALNGTTQMFAYDAEANSLACASCPPDGSLPVDDIFIRLDAEGNPEQFWQKTSTPERWVSSEGTVFFDTKTALLEADTNIVDDVYEYRRGELRLISSGGSARPSLFEDASRDGSTVIINTQEALVQQDKEPGVNKLYAARVGGGFPYIPPEAGCDFNAGACEGAGTSAPDQPGAGSAALVGPEDPKPVFKTRRRCPKGKRKVRRRGKVRCVKRHRKGRRHKKRGRAHKRTANHDRRAGR